MLRYLLLLLYCYISVLVAYVSGFEVALLDNTETNIVGLYKYLNLNTSIVSLKSKMGNSASLFEREQQ